jgi:predicted ribosomally synthesized peptide with nif11-like leader
MVSNLRADTRLRIGDTGGRQTSPTQRAMSEEQLKAFLEAVKADEGLQEKLKAAGDADAVIAIAKAAGFAISADELKKAQSEISEEELEGVAGGFGAGGFTLPPRCR